MYGTRRPRNRTTARWSEPIARARRVPECVVWRETRVASGWSQSALALALDTTRQTISKWERGTTWPQGDRLDRYLAVLLALDSRPPLPAPTVGRPVS